MKRFCRGQMFRNMFPYTRITFGNQDTMRNWFTKAWVFPKRREAKSVDLFRGACEEVVKLDEKAEDFLVYGVIAPAIAPPTPEQAGKQSLLLSLVKYSDEALVFFFSES